MFTLAVVNQSMMRLDALGLKTTMDHLPSFAMYRENARILMGYNWITRLWCRWIRPKMFPGRQSVAEQNAAQSSDALRSEFWEDIKRQYAGEIMKGI